MGGIVFQTDRLILREMTGEDLRDLAEMLLDPEVMYAYEHTFSTAEVLEWLERQQLRYRRDGFGLWALELRESGEMVGQAGLTWQPCEGETVLEIGYLLKRRHWHQGYAREAAAGCRDYAFTRLGAQRVHSLSRRTMRRPSGWPGPLGCAGKGIFGAVLQRSEAACLYTLDRRSFSLDASGPAAGKLRRVPGPGVQSRRICPERQDLIPKEK